MVKLPKELKIGGHVVKVLYPYNFKERVDLSGQYDGQYDEIRIAGCDMGGHARLESSVWVTLIHEILHAIDYTTGHRVFTDNEQAIEGISEMIYQVLVDHGCLWVTDKEAL